MYFPATQVLNFFDDPLDILKRIQSLDYCVKDGAYPGVRTEFLHEVDNPLFQLICKKILTIFYGSRGVDDLSWSVAMRCQKITSSDLVDGNLTWVHQDPASMLTAVIYMTESLFGNGTGIYTPVSSVVEYHPEMGEAKKKHFIDKQIPEKYVEINQDNNKKFRQVAYFDSVFNSVAMFDGCTPHKAELNLSDQDRYTIICFFHNIHAQNFPIPDLRRTI